MTKSIEAPVRTRSAEPASDRWPLHAAKARLSEVLQRANAHGPQVISVHGKEAAVVLSLKDFDRLNDGRTGQALIDALRACPASLNDLIAEPVFGTVSEPVRGLGS